MDYKSHTKQRFAQKFLPTIKSRRSKKFWKDSINKNWIELTDDDYVNLCLLSNNKPLFIDQLKNRVIVSYKGMFLWCVLSKKSKIIKTIYPISRSDKRNKLSSIVEV